MVLSEMFFTCKTERDSQLHEIPSNDPQEKFHLLKLSFPKLCLKISGSAPCPLAGPEVS
jgi:hypothetical protein